MSPAAAPMIGLEWWLQLAVLVLLGATLFHAVRLERALGAMRRDRTQLEGLLAGLDSSTQDAQSGLDRLRCLVDGAGREVSRQAGLAGALRDDLSFLVDRGERLALRLDELVRAGRSLEAAAPAPARPAPAAYAAAAFANAEPAQAAPAPATYAKVPYAPVAGASGPAPSTPDVPAGAAPVVRPVAWPAAPQQETPSMPSLPTQPASLAGAAPGKPDGTAADARHALRSQAERDLLLALRGAA